MYELYLRNQLLCHIQGSHNYLRLMKKLQAFKNITFPIILLVIINMVIESLILKQWLV